MHKIDNGRITVWLVGIVLFYVLALMAAPCSAAGDLVRQLRRFQEDLTVKRADLIDGEKQIIGLNEKLEPNDLPYINSIVVSLNSIATCLYYQSELSNVYGDVAGINAGYVGSQLPRMVRQVRFTHDSVDIEYKKITLQYLQVIDPAALKITDRLRENIRDTRQLLQLHLKWLESQSAETIEKSKSPNRATQKL